MRNTPNLAEQAEINAAILAAARLSAIEAEARVQIRDDLMARVGTDDELDALIIEQCATLAAFLIKLNERIFKAGQCTFQELAIYERSTWSLARCLHNLGTDRVDGALAEEIMGRAANFAEHLLARSAPHGFA